MTEGAGADSPVPEQGEVESPAAQPALSRGLGTLVQISPTERVPLGALLACYDPGCRQCSRGVVSFVLPAGKRERQVCRCCVKGFRKIAPKAEPPPPPKIHVAGLPNETQIRLLERRVATQRADLEERRTHHNVTLADLRAQAAINRRISEEDTAHAVEADRASAQRKAEAEALLVQLDQARGAWASAEETRTRLRAAALEATGREAALVRQVGEAERAFERNTAGARADLEKLERRLGLARARAGVPDPGALAIEEGLPPEGED